MISDNQGRIKSLSHFCGPRVRHGGDWQEKNRRVCNALAQDIREIRRRRILYGATWKRSVSTSFFERPIFRRQIEEGRSAYCVSRGRIGLRKKARRTRKAVEEEEITISEKLQIIEQVVRTHRFPHLIQYFCTIAKVSRSGYYNWLNAEDARQQRE